MGDEQKEFDLLVERQVLAKGVNLTGSEIEKGTLVQAVGYLDNEGLVSIAPVGNGIPIGATKEMILPKTDMESGVGYIDVTPRSQPEPKINWGDGHMEPCANCGETGYERDGMDCICNGCNATRDEVYEKVIVDLKDVATRLLAEHYVGDGKVVATDSLAPYLKEFSALLKKKG